MMLPRKLLKIVFSSFLIMGCTGFPKKPNVPLCVIDMPRQQLTCAPTGDINSVDKTKYGEMVDYIKKHPGNYKIPLDKADKYIAFSPVAWQDISVYLKTLRDVAEKRCK
jgi:hypothetical protein